MINGDYQLARSIIDGNRQMSDERQRLWHDIFAKYCGFRLSDPDHPDLKDPVENGAIFGVVDTKVAATTPQRPRGAFTPTEKREPYLGHAQQREIAVGHIFRERKLHRTLRKLNALARIAPHAFLKASWDWRDRMPRWEVLSPLECWIDESVSDILDASYIIRRRWFRKHELLDLVEGGVYPRDFLDAISPTPRVPESRFINRYGPDQIEPWVYEVYEIHDLHEGAVYHYSDRYGDFLLVQNQPENLFLPNPFFYLSFNEYLEGQRGLSEGEVIRGPAERLSRLDAIEYAHAKSTVPDILLNPAAFVDPEKAVEQLTRPRRPGQLLELPLQQNYTWAQAIGSTPTPNLPNAFGAARNAAGEDLAYRSGLPPYTRGQTGSKVATELALQKESDATRRAWDILLMQDAVVFCATSGIALLEEHLGENEVLNAGIDDGTGRLKGVAQLYRQSMGFRDPAVYVYEKATGQPHAAAVDYFYCPEAFEDPMTGNPTSRIATLQTLLNASNVVNPASPINGRHIAEALRLELRQPTDFLVPEQPMAPPGVGAAPGAAPPAMPPPAPAPTDPVAAGGLPPTITPPTSPPLPGPLGGAGHPAPVPKGAGLPGL